MNYIKILVVAFAVSSFLSSFVFAAVSEDCEKTVTPYKTIEFSKSIETHEWAIFKDAKNLGIAHEVFELVKKDLTQFQSKSNNEEEGEPTEAPVKEETFLWTSESQKENLSTVFQNLYEEEKPRDKAFLTHSFYKNFAEKMIKILEKDALKNAAAIKEIRNHLSAIKVLQNKIVTENFRLAISLASKILKNAHGLEDITQAGNIGLVIAAERYERRTGYKFSTYAYHWIKHEILSHIQVESHTIRLPLRVQLALSELRKANFLLTQKLKRNPTVEELAHETGFSILKIEELIQLERQNPSSIDALLNGKSEENLGSILTDSEHVSADTLLINKSSAENLKKAIQSLDSRTRFIIESYYGLVDGEELNMQEISEKLNISRERVRQILEKTKPLIKQSIIDIEKGPSPKAYWDKEKIVTVLKKMKSKNLPLDSSSIRKMSVKTVQELTGLERTGLSIYKAALHHFKSWDGALREIGIEPNNVKKLGEWNKTKIIAIIHQMKQEQIPLSSKRVRENDSAEIKAIIQTHSGKPLSGKSLEFSAYRYFGGWDEALIAAGFDPKTIHIQARWSKEKIIAALKALSQENLDLLSRANLSKDKTPFTSKIIFDATGEEATGAALLDRAVDYFKTYDKALLAAILSPSDIPEKGPSL